MCLEFLNQFLLSGLAWLALAVFVALIAALAALALFASPGRSSANHKTGSFTCPCYAPASAPESEAK